MSRVIKQADEIAFLQRVDDRYRVGETIREITESEGMTSPGQLHGRVTGLGFRFTREGGLMLVDALMNRPLRDWLESGDLVASEAPSPVAA